MGALYTTNQSENTLLTTASIPCYSGMMYSNVTWCLSRAHVPPIAKFNYIAAARFQVFIILWFHLDLDGRDLLCKFIFLKRNLYTIKVWLLPSFLVAYPTPCSCSFLQKENNCGKNILKIWKQTQIILHTFLKCFGYNSVERK